MTIEEALQSFLLALQSKRRSPNTLEWYERQIRAWLRWLSEQGVNGLGWLDPGLLDAFLLHEQGRGVKSSTVDARYRALRAFFNWLQKRQKLGGHTPPTALVERPEIKNPLPRQADPDDVQRLLNAIQIETWLDARDLVLIELLRSTGLRVDEAVKLRIHDVDATEGFVYVASGKGDKDRIAPFDERFKRAFVTYLFNRPAWPGPELFLGANRYRQPIGPLTTSGVRQMMTRRCKAADIPHLNPHSLRHMFAIKALNDGVSLSAVSAILGHTSPAFTARRYAKWVKRGLRREYDTHWQR